MNIKKIFQLYRRLAVTVAAVVALAIAALVMAPAANAASASPADYQPLNAHGCTAAVGGEQCITINGTGVDINYIDNLHYTVTLTKCQLYARFIYQENGTVKYQTPYYSGCYGPGYYVRWNTTNQVFDAGVPACTTSKDSLTSGNWTNQACKTIG